MATHLSLEETVEHTAIQCLRLLRTDRRCETEWDAPSRYENMCSRNRRYDTSSDVLRLFRSCILLVGNSPGASRSIAGGDVVPCCSCCSLHTSFGIQSGCCANSTFLFTCLPYLWNIPTLPRRERLILELLQQRRNRTASTLANESPRHYRAARHLCLPQSRMV